MEIQINDLSYDIEVVFTSSNKVTIPKTGLLTRIEGNNLILIPGPQAVGGSGELTILFTDVTSPATANVTALRNVILDYVQAGDGSSGGGAAGGGNNTYSTEQGDFTAEISDGTNEITLNVANIGGVAIAENHFLNGILKVYDVSTEEVVTIILDDFTWTPGTKKLDTTNCGNAFTFNTGDIVSLTLIGPDKGYDKGLGGQKSLQQNFVPKPEQSTIPFVSASDVGATDNAYVEQGTIPVEDFDYIRLFVNYVDNDSSAGKIKLKHLHETGGSDKYDSDATDNDERDILEDDKTSHLFDVRGVREVSVQTKATTVGATKGTVTIEYMPVLAS